MTYDEMTIEELAEEECEEEDNDENGYSELDELFERNGEEDEENEFPSPEFSDMPTYEPMRTITEIAQPVKTIVEVGAKELANGNITPFCKFVIERNLTEQTNEFEVIGNDFETLIKRVKETMDRFRGDD